MFSQHLLTIAWGGLVVSKQWKEAQKKRGTLRLEIHQVHASAAIPVIYILIYYFHPSWLTVSAPALALWASDPSSGPLICGHLRQGGAFLESSSFGHL